MYVRVLDGFFVGFGVGFFGMGFFGGMGERRF